MKHNFEYWEEIETILLEQIKELMQKETTPKADTLEVVEKMISLALAAATVIRQYKSQFDARSHWASTRRQAVKNLVDSHFE